MAYQVDVILQKVVCRNPESVTTGDLFALSGAIVTDQSAKAFVTPIRILRSNESFTYNQPIFSGFAETLRLGIAFTAWDKDLNTAWVTNEPEIREKEAEIEKATGKHYGLPVFYMTQLLALACGVAPGKLGLDSMIVSPQPLLKSRDLI